MEITAVFLIGFLIAVYMFIEKNLVTPPLFRRVFIIASCLLAMKAF